MDRTHELERLYPIPQQWDYMIPFTPRHGTLTKIDEILDVPLNLSRSVKVLYMSTNNMSKLRALLSGYRWVVDNSVKMATYAGVPIIVRDDLSDEYIGVVC